MVLFKKVFLFFGFLFLASCDGGVFNPMGYIAESQRSLIILSAVIMLAVIVPVVFLTVLFAFKYRETNKDAEKNYDPSWIHSNKLEIVWWGIPILIIGYLSYITYVSSHQLAPEKMIDKAVSDKEPVVIQAVALNWKWLFIYENENIATVNELYLPIDTPVKFKITADAPMNAFWIPQLAGMIYAMGGMETKLHMIANEVGVYDGRSSNYSGFGFSEMTFKAHATSEQDYNDWVNKIKSNGSILTKDHYNETLVPDTYSHPIEKYGSVEEGLFGYIIQKYLILDGQPGGIDLEAHGMGHMIEGSRHHHDSHEGMSHDNHEGHNNGGDNHNHEEHDNSNHAHH